MKKILVTGGLGYIGSHTCVDLLEKNYEIIIVDNLCNSELDTLDSIYSITKKKNLNFSTVTLQIMRNYFIYLKQII